MVRTRIAERPKEWRSARDAVEKKLGGLSDEDALSRPPRGFDPDHPMIEDIKKKSFFAGVERDETAAGSPAFVRAVAKAYADAAPLMKFLCNAVGANF
jgi:uncharacterized protein (DUF2461 family)